MRRHRSLATLLTLVLGGSLVAGCTSDTSDASFARTSDVNSPMASTDLVNPATVAGVDIPQGQIDDAVGRLDELARELMDSSGLPGMAVAVVHDGQTVYAKGFGVREVGTDQKVDADTVFQLASLSKPVGATVVARQVGAGIIDWDTPVSSALPDFSLADPWVTEHVTVGDLYSHRSGLPDHVGDKLEDLGYNRQQILDKLRLEPLSPFRISYAYTNFGLTAAAEAVAAASGTDWATLSEQAIYQPLGMTSTSSRYADYQVEDDRATAHQLINGIYVPAERDPDAQSPAGGVSSSANDISKWMAMLLADGSFDDRQIVDQDALLPAVSPQVVSVPPRSPDARPGMYGYGFNVSTTPAGRVSLSHSGAFQLGVAANFVAIPSADVAIVALTNGTPVGIPETLTAEFADLVQFGAIREDWRSLYAEAFASMRAPEGSLVARDAPTNPAPAQPLHTYTGVYDNDYWGPAVISEDGDALSLQLGPAGQSFPLTHWSGDEFTFMLSNENAPPGTISKATFAGDGITLEYYNTHGQGTFVR
ncbi:serine hydrolase [Rhodococcus sp. WMMA185]|uniref:serine hydrolase n=1 Tax=Rhodococcus sp. WMMA185 TaxID=679318 RepID=UPI0008783E93|nr:serine hydrolase [Rhodococcus sp. WMMA185]AOW91910.1 serine hydrolase [Rhodococcus sp. WMMA185]